MPSRPPKHRPFGNQTKRHEPHVFSSKSSTKRGYGYKWQQARAGYLQHNPLCVMCESEGRVQAATDVDHIIPHKGDMKLFWDRNNWQSLCHPHHSQKTAKEDGGFGNFRR